MNPISNPNVKRVLAIDPYSRGVGFALLEGPDTLIDWGLRSTGKADSRKSVRVIEKLLKHFQPDVLVIEAWNSTESRRCRRIETLLQRIATDQQNNLEVRAVTKQDLRSIGPLPYSSTKYGRACLTAERFPELKAFLPRFRKPWMSEDDRMSIFDAVGFAAAFFGTDKQTSTDDSAQPVH